MEDFVIIHRTSRLPLLNEAGQKSGQKRVCMVNKIGYFPSSLFVTKIGHEALPFIRHSSVKKRMKVYLVRHGAMQKKHG